MICHNCHNAEAAVFVQTIVGNKVEKRALCAACAAESQISHAFQGMLSGLLPPFMKMARPAPRGKALQCSGCGMTYADLRETQRLGCPSCYDAFEPYLKSILPRIHGGAVAHRGSEPDQV